MENLQTQVFSKVHSYTLQENDDVILYFLKKGSVFRAF